MKLHHLYARIYPWLPFAGGVLALVLALVLRFFPELTDEVYRNVLFAGIRWLIDSTFGWLPFAVFWLVFAAVFLFLLRGWMRRTLFIYRPWYRGIANAIGWLLMAFYMLWGFNYSAPGFVDKAGITVDEPVEGFQQVLFERALSEATAARAAADTSGFFLSGDRGTLLQVIHTEVRSVLHDAGFATPGNPTMRLVPGGVMRRLGVSGIYFPFSGECHTDASYLPLRRYAIAAHEYAHAYGVTDEGECNLIGFLALARSRNATLRYSAWLDVLLSLRFGMDELPASIQHDIERLRADALNYTPFVPGMAEFTNNLYLKANGVDEGINSYARTPVLVNAAIEQGWLDERP